MYFSIRPPCARISTAMASHAVRMFSCSSSGLSRSASAVKPDMSAKSTVTCRVSPSGDSTGVRRLPHFPQKLKSTGISVAHLGQVTVRGMGRSLVRRMTQSVSTECATKSPIQVSFGVLDPRWRGLTIGLVLNVTFVAFEALAIATVMPLVADDLSGLALYGWVFSSFLLADLVGIVLAGELADRSGPAVPFGVGLVLFAIGLLLGGLAPSMPVLVAARAALVLAALQARDLVLTPIMLAAGLTVGVPSLRRLLPPGTLTARGALPAAVLARGLLTFAFFAADVFVPLTVTSLRGESVLISGLALTAGTVAWTSGAWIQERTVLGVGPAPLVRIGFLLVTVGTLGMALVLGGAVPGWSAIVAWGIAGLGIGMAYSSISLAVLLHAAAGSEGATASSMQLADVLGNALGTGLGAVAVAISVASLGGAGPGVAATDGLAVASAIGGAAIAGRLRG